MKVMPATEGDWASIRTLLVDAGLPVDDLGEGTLDHFLVGRHDVTGMDIAGAVGLELYGEIGLLRSLVVQQRERSSGVGAGLVAALEAKAGKSGVAELYLLTIDADRYFLHLGYEAVERNAAPERIRATREFAELCPDDAIVMRKRLRKRKEGIR